MNRRGKIILITGIRNVGKTSFCTRLIRLARWRGLDVAGIFSPGVFLDGKKIRIEVEDIRTGERKHLAGLKMAPGVGTSTDHWFFDRDALAWGDRRFLNAVPCEILFVDELGPLEFQQGKGWPTALETIDSYAFRIAFVVVRPELIDTAKRRWPDAKILHITHFNRLWVAIPWIIRIGLSII